jgi:hypothetical protein
MLLQPKINSALENHIKWRWRSLHDYLVGAKLIEVTKYKNKLASSDTILTLDFINNPSSKQQL